MSAEYDKDRTAALVKEAQEITSHLKVETEGLKRQMARVLDGDEEAAVGPTASHKVVESASSTTAATAAKSGWSFWR
jgi:hypothetical protein